MKSRTSSSKAALLWKDITRFFPVWGIYTLCLLVGLFLLGVDDLGFWFPYNISNGIPLMSVINCGYALVVAATVFGDLYNPRMCNSLHAMPVKRETWFSVHVMAGLLFSLVPTALMTAAAMPFMQYSFVEDVWQIPLLWFGTTNLQYLFFFGLAVFCAFCVGNRVGLAVLYGSVNFGSLFAYFLADSLYVPMLHGVVVQASSFLILSPVAQLSSEYLVEMDRKFIGSQTLPNGDQMQLYEGWFTIRWEEYTYLAILIPIGIALFFGARWMYRRRNLECAGDFAATRAIGWVLQVLLALAGAGIINLLVAFVGLESNDMTVTLAISAIGLVIGWFAGRMFIERSTRVFRLKNWLGLGALTVAVAASFGLTYLDPLGIEDYVPDAEDIKSGRLELAYSTQVTLEEPEEIADLIRIHQLALEDKLVGTMTAVNTMPTIAENGVGELNGEQKDSVFIRLSYTLKNGHQVQREYYIWMDSEEGQLVRHYASSLEGVIGYWNAECIETEEDLLDTVEYMTRVNVYGTWVDADWLTAEKKESLLRAIAADCEAGTMVQHMTFHEEKVLEDGEYGLWSYSLDIEYNDNPGIYIQVYKDAENTMAWFEEAGVLEIISDPDYQVYG